MEPAQFEKAMLAVAKYAINYKENVATLRPLPKVEPGYLKKKLDGNPPSKGIKWERMMEDLKRAIEPGLAHWSHPSFHAYFPAYSVYASVLGDFLCSIYGSVGFSWSSCPALTELEIIVLDMLAQMFGLPNQFHHSSGVGGGFFHNGASDCVFAAVLCAKHRTMKDLTKKHPKVPVALLQAKLVGYTSCMAHSCAVKAGLIIGVKIREMDVDNEYRMTGATVKEAIKMDLKAGLIPFIILSSAGTTGTSGFDHINEMAPLCEKYNLWLNIDGAYGANCLVCPEFRFLIPAIDKADSINCNLNKGLVMAYDSSVIFVRDKSILEEVFTVDPVYLLHKKQEPSIDLRHYGLAFSRRFRSLHIWFCLRLHGIKFMQDYIRRSHELALKLAEWIENEPLVVLTIPPVMGLVCFRMKDSNYQTQMLLRAINKSEYAHMVPCLAGSDFIIRWNIGSEKTTEEDLDHTWKMVAHYAKEIHQGVEEKELHTLRSKQRLKSILDAPEDQLPSYGGKRRESDLFLFDCNIPSRATLPPHKDARENAIKRYRKLSVINNTMLDPEYLDEETIDNVLASKSKSPR